MSAPLPHGEWGVLSRRFRRLMDGAAPLGPLRRMINSARSAIAERARSWNSLGPDPGPYLLMQVECGFAATRPEGQNLGRSEPIAWSCQRTGAAPSLWRSESVALGNSPTAPASPRALALGSVCATRVGPPCGH